MICRRSVSPAQSSDRRRSFCVGAGQLVNIQHLSNDSLQSSVLKLGVNGRTTPGPDVRPALPWHPRWCFSRMRCDRESILAGIAILPRDRRADGMLEIDSLALESHKQSDVFPFHQDVNANDPSSSHCLVSTELCLDSVTTRTAVSRIFISSSVAYPNSSSVDPKTSSIDPTSESLDQQPQKIFGPIPKYPHPSF
jgi:hypothetical protein